MVAAPLQQDRFVNSDCYQQSTPPTDPGACLAAPGKVAYAIDRTVGAPVDRSGTGTEVLQEKSQGAADGTAKLDQNLNRSSSGQPPWIVNAGRYSSNFDILAAGVNVHF